MHCKKKVSNYDYTSIIIGFFAILIFVSIYGIYVINPCYTDWLFERGDLTQHYLGWVAYRNSSWYFPIGMTDALAYPNLTSIIFTDSIPLFAVFFKLLSPILPCDFQYFGLWGIMCFLLQGIFVGKIVNRYTDNKVIIVLCGILSLISPVMLMRMYGHTALAGHWIIIYGIKLLVNHDNKRIYSLITLLSLLSASIHIYFVLMNGIIVLGIYLIEVTKNKNYLKNLLILFDYIIVGICVISILGGFNSNMEAQNDGLGEYSFNLNGFFNPQGKSCVLHDLPTYSHGQYEGFGYLGLGFIFLIFICIFLLFIKKDLLKVFKKKWKIEVSFLAIFVISILVAVSPIITFGDRLIIKINVPTLIIDIWSIFRASGRIIWIDVYIIEILCYILLIYSIKNKKTIYIILTLAIVIQFYDIHKFLAQKYETFGIKIKYENKIDEYQFWNDIGADGKIKHLVYFDLPDKDAIFLLTDWALDNGKTLSNFYFSRSMDEMINKSKDNYLNNISDDIIFVFPEDSKMNCLKYNLNYYHVDNLIIGYINEIDGYNKMSKKDFWKD